MKQLILCIALLCSYASHAQFETSVKTKNAESSISTNGNLFFKNSSVAGFNILQSSENDNPVPTIYAGSLWLGAKNPNETFLHAANQYLDVSYAHGPQDYSGNFNFDTIWKVTGNEILEFQMDFVDGEINDQIPASILFWPGRNNENLAVSLPIGNFAPFFDQSGDGKYEPYDGDYPIVSYDLPYVIPFELAYSVIHDQDFQGNAPIGVNIHVSMYSLECEDIPALEQAIFTHHFIENVSNTSYEEFFIGLWLDHDLGCYTDDFNGCSPSNNMSYVYNQNAIDGEGGVCATGEETFGSNPAVHGSKFLNRSLSSYSVLHRPAAGTFPPGTFSPETPEEFQQVMEGRWRDGIPLTFGGTGYNIASNDTVSHLFFEPPSDPSSWAMTNVNLGPMDIRTISMNTAGAFGAGEAMIIDMVQMATIDSSYDHLEKIALNIEEMQTIQEAFDNQFDNQCFLTVGTNELLIQQAAFDIFPNPNSNSFRLQSELSIDHLYIYDLQGQVVFQTNVNNRIFDLEHNLENGVYFVQLLLKNKTTAASKMVILN